MRFNRLTSVLVPLCVLLGCDKKDPASSLPNRGTPTAVASGSTTKKTGSDTASAKVANPATQEVDYTMTVEELNKEQKALKKGFKAKYDGKRVELTGKVLSVTAGGFIGFALYGDLANGEPVNVVLRKEDQSKFQGMKALSRSQTVTVRGKLRESFGARFDEAELVSVGPTPAVGTTVAALVEDFARPDDQKKLNEVLFDVVVRAEVHANRHLKGDPDPVNTLSISDPGKKDQMIDAKLDVVSPEEVKSWASIKPGAVVILIGQTHFRVESGRKILQMVAARVLNAPPEGLTLPAADK